MNDEETDVVEWIEERRYEEPLPLWKKLANVIRFILHLPTYAPTEVICMRASDDPSILLLPPPKDPL